MSLTEQLDKMREGAKTRTPANIRATMAKAVDDLRASGIAERSLGEGEQIPAFALPNAHGETVRSADLLAHGPAVLSFYRGGWCPYCNLELKALQEALPEISGLGASLVAISPELPDKAMTTTEKHGLGFEVLSDRGNQVARAFGLVFTLAEELRPVYEAFGIDVPAYNGDETFELPIPATFVVDRDGTVRRAFVDPDYTRRLDPADVIAALAA